MINENISFQTVEYMQQRIQELTTENMGLFSRPIIEKFVAEAYADGQADERVKIVAWLRSPCGEAWRGFEDQAIEAGEHLK